MDKEDLAKAFASDLKKLVAENHHPIIVHGGGPQINLILSKLNIESSFYEGLRITDNATRDVVQMVLSGLVNKNLVSLFTKEGISCAGLSGVDANLLLGQIKNEKLGLVGDIIKIDPNIIKVLLNNNIMPIIAPIAKDTQGEILNINADTAAGSIAGSLHADVFVLVSDVPGVLDKNEKIIPNLNLNEIKKLKEEKIIYGGMIPKVDSCLNALAKGCKKALILDGRIQGNLYRALTLKNNIKATTITL